MRYTNTEGPTAVIIVCWIITIVLTILKLSGSIACSWWWVVSPFFIVGGILVFVLSTVFLGILLLEWLKTVRRIK